MPTACLECGRGLHFKFLCNPVVFAIRIEITVQMNLLYVLSVHFSVKKFQRNADFTELCYEIPRNTELRMTGFCQNTEFCRYVIP